MTERRDAPLNPDLEQFQPTEREQQAYDLWRKTAAATHKLLADMLADDGEYMFIKTK